MRIWPVIFLGLITSLARAEKIVLVPLDSRPASGQFAQMIGKIANCDIVMPPYEDLGRFTNPGVPEYILDWLEKLDFTDVKSVVVSTDMIAYGGLIASRTPDTSLATAMHRLRRLEEIRQAHPSVRFYGFSSIMRLYATGTKSSARWAMPLGRYEEAKDRYREEGTTALFQSAQALGAKLPPALISWYEAARLRDFTVQQELLRMTKKGLFDYCILGQDDAKQYGPFIPETRKLHSEVDDLAIGGRIYFCEGIDQLSNVLVSRALLRQTDWIPRIRIVYSDPDGKMKIASYESKDIEDSLADQIFASGARPIDENDPTCDYTLYVNTPGRNEDKFQAFLMDLNNDADHGIPAAVADIDLAKDGTADPELFNSLLQNGRMTKLLSFAGWNTAGNTMGTTIPAANVYLFAKKTGTDALERETAQREFLLHRFVNDYDYHKFTRPVAYKLIDATPTANREETYGKDFVMINDFVKRDLNKHLIDTFDQEFLGQKFTADNKEYEVSGLDDVKIFLPWPRVYEVRIEFKFQTKEVAPVSDK
ncbi:MAG TPA: DUF4127 family protein [Fimbriimonadaceae bacterium]